MDTQRIRQLLDRRDEIDRELAEAVSGNGNGNGHKKTVKCSACGEEGHTARTCTNKPAPPPPVNDAFAGQ